MSPDRDPERDPAASSAPNARCERLGTRVTALADGQLGPAATERALAHVAGCAPCAAELAAARAVRATLRASDGAGDAGVRPSDELVQRLLALPAARDMTRPAALGSGPALPSAASPAWRPSGGAAALLVSGAAGVLGIGVLAVLGSAVDVTPARHPAAALAVLSAHPGPTDEQLLTVEAPGSSTAEALAWLEDHGWASPAALPADVQLAGLEVLGGGEAVELELQTSTGTVVVVQRHGRLDPAVLRAADAVDVDGVVVHVLSSEPWHGVWQCGDTVVDVVAQVPSDALGDLISAYPATEYDDGVPARIARGWNTLVGAWSP